MDKQKLPLQVIKEINELLLYIRHEVKNSSLSFKIELLNDFGFQISPKAYPDFNFILDKYEVKANAIKYTVRISYFNRFSEREGYSFNEKETEVNKHFDDWLTRIINYNKEYNELMQIDFDHLVQLEEGEELIQPQDDIFEEKDKILPYSLKTLSVSKFQGIKHATVENLPVDTQWVFLVGENGFGKSTVLQSMMLGLHGSKDGNYEIIQNQDIRIQVEYKSDKENFINDCWKNLHPLAHLAAYGPSRLNLQGDIDITEEERRSLVTYGLFFTNGNLLNINAELYKWALKKDKRFELVKKAFCKLIPYLADVRPNKETDQIEYIEKDILEGTETYEPLPYQKLASGFRAIIGIAGDMIIRLSRSQPKVTDPAKLKGIVIIDELDLHWHPKLQKQIPKLFSSVFPKVQFIVSTHSPIPLLGAPHNSVILKVTRTKEEGVKIERVDVDLKYLTPNLILTSGIFDMDDVLSVENDDLTKTRTEDSFEEMKHNDEVDDYLAEFEKSNRQFPDELFEPKAN